MFTRWENCYQMCIDEAGKRNESGLNLSACMSRATVIFDDSTKELVISFSNYSIPVVYRGKLNDTPLGSYFHLKTAPCYSAKKIIGEARMSHYYDGYGEHLVGVYAEEGTDYAKEDGFWRIDLVNRKEIET